MAIPPGSLGGCVGATGEHGRQPTKNQCPLLLVPRADWNHLGRFEI